MRPLFSTWGRVLAATWPTVLAWYLGGVVVREAVLSLAAPLGRDSALAAFLLLPLAVLARLVSYVGMFLAVRRALPQLGSVVVPGAQGAVRRFLDVLLAAIVPFFVLYGVVGLLQEDLESYANRAARYSFGVGLRFLEPGNGPLVVLVIVLAFLGRQALARFGDRLPRGAALLEIYLEAVWVFIAVSGIGAVLGPVLVWLRERQVVRWVLDARQALRDLWDPIRVAIDGIDGLVPLVLQLVALPLAWLLVVGIVSTRDLAAIAEERVVPRRVEARLRLLLGRLPRTLARRRRWVDDQWDSFYRPATVAGRIIAGTDPGALAAYLACAALLVGGGQWALYGLTRLIGQHEPGWWFTAYPIVYLAVFAVVEPVRVGLLGSAFDQGVGARRRVVSARTATAAAAAAAPPTGTPPA